MEKEDLLGTEQKSSKVLLEEARKKAEIFLNLDLRTPKQEKRIKALTDLYKKYSQQTDIRGFIYSDIIDYCNQLIKIHQEKRVQLEAIKLLTKESFSSLKIMLENINFKYSAEIKQLEDKLFFSKKLIRAYETKYHEGKGIDSVYRKKLRELGNTCWDNWLKALDVNKELRNTIIGFENRKSLLAISRAYVDYFVLADVEISRCFDKLKEFKKEGILEYYEALSYYKLPIGKKMDFRLFLQKKIESKLFDAAEIKTLFGDFATNARDQIDNLIGEVRAQYDRDYKDICAIVNYYKKFLLNKQVLFTNETEQLVIYFKKRYIEKIDFLCSRFQMFSAELTVSTRRFSESHLSLVKKILEEHFDFQLNHLKIDYSKKFIPFLDNFWHMEQAAETEYATDEEALLEKLKKLKISKNLGLKGLISEFEAQRDELKQYFDKKIDLLTGVNKFGVKGFDVALNELKEDCDVLCCELINLNARFWTKANAKFNCEARKFLIKLREKYAPYINSWRSESKSWMNEYLITNLNQELLKAVGEAVRDFSPESDLYLKTSKALFNFNEFTRIIMANRDKMETEQLILLNTLPVSKTDSLKTEANKKLAESKQSYIDFWNDYNNFYNSILLKT